MFGINPTRRSGDLVVLNLVGNQNDAPQRKICHYKSAGRSLKESSAIGAGSRFDRCNVESQGIRGLTLGKDSDRGGEQYACVYIQKEPPHVGPLVLTCINKSNLLLAPWGGRQPWSIQRELPFRYRPRQRRRSHRELARGVETGAAQEIAEIEERIARYVRMLAQEAGEGGIGGKVGLVGEKGRVVRQHDLEVGRIPAEQADELGFGSVGVRLFGHGRGRLRQSGGGQHRGK